MANRPTESPSTIRSEGQSTATSRRGDRARRPPPATCSSPQRRTEPWRGRDKSVEIATPTGWRWPATMCRPVLGEQLIHGSTFAPGQRPWTISRRRRLLGIPGVLSVPEIPTAPARGGCASVSNWAARRPPVTEWQSTTGTAVVKCGRGERPTDVITADPGALPAAGLPDALQLPRAPAGS